MTTCIKHTSLLLLIGLSLFSACKSTETVPAATGRVSLGINKSARVGTDLTVRVDTIMDSRCPSGANCIWEGQAFVSAVLSNQIVQQRVRLYSHSLPLANQPDSVNVILSGRTYKIVLRDVVPYPDLTKQQPEQQAVIQVTKL